MGIFQGTERAMVRTYVWSEMNEQESTKDLMQMLDLNETIDHLAKASNVRWYGHVSRKDKNNFLKRALDFTIKGKMKRVRPKKTWLRAVVKQRKKLG